MHEDHTKEYGIEYTDENLQRQVMKAPICAKYWEI